MRRADITEWPLVRGRLRLRTSFPARRQWHVCSLSRGRAPAGYCIWPWAIPKQAVHAPTGAPTTPRGPPQRLRLVGVALASGPRIERGGGPLSGGGGAQRTRIAPFHEHGRRPREVVRRRKLRAVGRWRPLRSVPGGRSLREVRGRQHGPGLWGRRFADGGGRVGLCGGPEGGGGLRRDARGTSVVWVGGRGPPGVGGKGNGGGEGPGAMGVGGEAPARVRDERKGGSGCVRRPGPHGVRVGEAPAGVRGEMRGWREGPGCVRGRGAECAQGRHKDPFVYVRWRRCQGDLAEVDPVVLDRHDRGLQGSGAPGPGRVAGHRLGIFV